MDASTQGMLQADTSERQTFFIIVTLPFTSTRVVVAKPQTRVFAGALGVKFCLCLYKTACGSLLAGFCCAAWVPRLPKARSVKVGLGGGLEGQLTVGLQTGCGGALSCASEGSKGSVSCEVGTVLLAPAHLARLKKIRESNRIRSR